MSFTRIMTAAVFCGGLAVAGAGGAAAEPGDAPVPSADVALNGGFVYFLEGNRWAVWVINSSCDPAGFCTGKVTSSRNWTAPITRGPGTWWGLQRDSPADGWVCPDGAQAPAHYQYLLDPATLAGTVTYTNAPGACGTPETPSDTDVIALSLI